jgi:hypothetical protein
LREDGVETWRCAGARFRMAEEEEEEEMGLPLVSCAGERGGCELQARRMEMVIPAGEMRNLG